MGKNPTTIRRSARESCSAAILSWICGGVEGGSGSGHGPPMPIPIADGLPLDLRQASGDDLLGRTILDGEAGTSPACRVSGRGGGARAAAAGALAALSLAACARNAAPATFAIPDIAAARIRLVCPPGPRIGPATADCPPPPPRAAGSQ